jgi:hypothetical protein
MSTPKKDETSKSTEMVNTQQGTEVSVSAQADPKTEGSANTWKEKMKAFKAKTGDPDHPYYWDKLVVLELVEMGLSSINMYQAFRLDIWNSTYYYVLIYIFMGISLDLVSLAEYLYVRFRLFPSESLAPLAKKEKIRWVLTLFTTKEIVADTCHLYAAMELKNFIMFFESNLDSNKAENAGVVILAVISIVYGIISLLEFLYGAFESYIEVVDCEPFNGGSRLLRWLDRWKKAMIVVMLAGLIVSQILQIQSDDKQTTCVEGMTTYNPSRSRMFGNVTKSADEKDTQCPCACVKRPCFSSSCTTDKFRRIECSLTNEDGTLQSCGDVFAGPTVTDRVIEEFKYVESGIRPLTEEYFDGEGETISLEKCKELERQRDEGDYDKFCRRRKIGYKGPPLTSIDDLGFNKFFLGLFGGLNNVYNRSVQHMTCGYCNDMWLSNAKDTLLIHDGFTRGNKCLCNETVLKIEKRKVKLGEMIESLFDAVNDCDYYNCRANLTVKEKIYQFGFDGKFLDNGNIKVSRYPVNMELTRKIETCSSQYFHGFRNELTCGRMLNTKAESGVSLAAALIIILGFVLYLLIWSCITSICLRRCVCHRKKCRYMFCIPFCCIRKLDIPLCCCKKCDRDEDPCCKRQCGDHPDDDSNDETQSKKGRRFSNRRSSNPNLVYKPENQEGEDKSAARI